jgi:hypothetical protein
MHNYFLPLIERAESEQERGKLKASEKVEERVVKESGSLNSFYSVSYHSGNQDCYGNPI